MIAHLDPSEDACFSVFCRGPLDYRVAPIACRQQHARHTDPEPARFAALRGSALDDQVS